MNLSKIVVSTAIAAMLASTGFVSTAAAKDRAAEVTVLPDGTTVAVARTGKSRVFGRDTTLDMAFHCTPVCVKVGEVSGEGPGLAASILPSAFQATGLGYGMKMLRPSSPTTINSSGSFSSADSQGGQAFGGTSISDAQGGLAFGGTSISDAQGGLAIVDEDNSSTYIDASEDLCLAGTLGNNYC